jgi:hypothetical protein
MVRLLDLLENLCSSATRPSKAKQTFAAENYYTADYPEDEVETDDEFDRHAYLYRNGNASDEEEFDNREYNDSDEDDDKILLEGDDDDVTMARIRTYMQRHTPYQ